MREIKFRVWDKIGGEWLETKNISILGNGWVEWINDDSTTQPLEENSYEVCFYVGIKDKNGRNICQGDILYTPNGIREVIYQGWSFSLGDGDFVTEFGYGKDEIRPGDCIIMGNIYENSDLLETSL